MIITVSYVFFSRPAARNGVDEMEEAESERGWGFGFVLVAGPRVGPGVTMPGSESFN